MSLDFSVERMKNYDVLTTVIIEYGDNLPKRNWHQITNDLVYATMAVDMGEITEENWQEFYKRLNIYQRLLSEGATLITPLEVYMHIGLSTNVFTLPYDEWFEKVMKRYDELNKRYMDKAEGLYNDAGLETMTDEQFQKLIRVEGETLDQKIRNTTKEVEAF